jgi:hypothetical protein
MSKRVWSPLCEARAPSGAAGCAVSACLPPPWWLMAAAPAPTSAGIAGTRGDAPNAGRRNAHGRLTFTRALRKPGDRGAGSWQAQEPPGRHRHSAARGDGWPGAVQAAPAGARWARTGLVCGARQSRLGQPPPPRLLSRLPARGVQHPGCGSVGTGHATSRAPTSSGRGDRYAPADTSGISCLPLQARWLLTLAPRRAAGTSGRGTGLRVGT